MEWLITPMRGICKVTSGALIYWEQPLRSLTKVILTALLAEKMMAMAAPLSLLMEESPCLWLKTVVVNASPLLRHPRLYATPLGRDILLSPVQVSTLSIMMTSPPL